MPDPTTLDIDKKTIAEILVRYLSSTTPVMLFIHLLWLMVICAVLSTTYVVSFHFTSLLSVYQDAHNIQNFNNNLLSSKKQDGNVNSILEELLESSKANRAYVFRYHNGLAAVSGVPFFFQSNTHEVISPGTPRVIQFEQHIPASINIAISNQFMQDKCAIIPKADDDKDSQNYWFYQNRGARSLVRCPIFMSNGDLFGFVGIDYLDRIDPARLTLQSERLRSAASSIASVFATKK